MKVLFLDHQGVMYTRKHPYPGRLDDFDVESVCKLNEFLESHLDWQIVVSSDWKLWVDLPTMQDFYTKQDIQQPIDYTPNLPRLRGESLARRRAREINTWIGEHPCEDWIAIDDLDMRGLVRNFMWIQPTILP